MINFVCANVHGPCREAASQCSSAPQDFVRCYLSHFGYSRELAKLRTKEESELEEQEAASAEADAEQRARARVDVFALADELE